MRRAGFIGSRISGRGTDTIAASDTEGARISGPAVMLLWQSRRELGASCPGIVADCDWRASSVHPSGQITGSVA